MRYTSTSLYRYAGGKNKMKDEIIEIINGDSSKSFLFDVTFHGWRLY